MFIQKNIRANIARLTFAFLIFQGAITVNAATTPNNGWKLSVANDFSSPANLTGWEFTLPWNSTDKTSDYVLQNGYLELQMNQTDKGGNVLSPKFDVGNNIKVTVRHYMHMTGGGVYLGGITLRDETSIPTYTGIANYIELGFQHSSASSDYACSGYDIPRVDDTKGCIINTLQSATSSSNLYDKWITTVMTYNKTSGRLTIDYENDGIIDFNGVVQNRFKVTRISFSGYGWYTGHFHRIDSVRIESLN